MHRAFRAVRVLWIALLLSSLATGSTLAASPSLSPMQPPVKVQIDLASDDQLWAIRSANPGTKLSKMLEFLPTLVIKVNKEGVASGSYSVRSRVSDGSYTTRGTFSFGGSYKNGRLVGSWTYNGKRDGDLSGYNLGSQFYDASGDFISTSTIEATGGTGYLTGELIWTHTECDKQDTDTRSATFGACLEKNIHSDREKFTIDWTAKPLCGTASTLSCECKVQDSFARFNSLTGRVEVNCDEDETDWVGALLDMVLYVGDRIATREDSSAILQFEDMNTYVMRPNTQIVIETPPEKETKIGLVMGRLWCNIKSLLLEGRLEIETTQGVAGIKGTTLVMETDGNSTTLKVIAGTVEFKSKSSGQTTLVAAGQQVTADEFDLLPVTSFDAQAELASWAAAAPPAILEPSKGVVFVEPRAASTPTLAVKTVEPAPVSTPTLAVKTVEPARVSTATAKPQATASPDQPRGSSGGLILGAGVVLLAALGVGFFLLRRK